MCSTPTRSASRWSAWPRRRPYPSHRAPGPAATLSLRRDRTALASAFAAIELSGERLLARCNSIAARKAYATQYQRFIFSAYPEVPDLVRVAEERVGALGGSDLRIAGGT